MRDVIIHDSSEDNRPEKKYGRTLARDAETLQRGGIPDWTPLGKQTEVDRPIAAKALTAPDKSVLPPRAHTLTPPLVTPIKTYSPKERLVAASPLAPAAPAPSAPIPPAESPPPPPAHTSAPPLISPIETYSGDFMEMMKETHASAATVLAAEQDKAPRGVPQAAGEAPRTSNLLYIIAGAILLIAGGAGAYVAYTRYLSALAPIEPLLGVSAPIFVDEREQISGSGPAIFNAVEASLARPLAPGTVRLLYGATATTSIIATLLAKAPDIVLRNANSGKSMVGIVNAGNVTSPFFILTVSSYGNTFSGMLWWEKSMPRDLSALFGAYPLLAGTTASSTGSRQATVSTSSRQATNALATGFRDEVIGNHDARVYRDEALRSVLLYGYWDKTTLILARDPSAFIEILQRLAASRAQ